MTEDHSSCIRKNFDQFKSPKIYTDKLINYKYLIPKEIYQTKKFGTNSILINNRNFYKGIFSRAVTVKRSDFEESIYQE